MSVDEAMDPDRSLEISADEGVFNELTRRGLFSGNVDLLYGTQRLSTDSLHVDEGKSRFDALGNVIFKDRGFTIKGPQAELNTATEKGAFSQATWFFSPRHARGEASRIYRKSEDVLSLRNATYTTCDPGSDDWKLSAKKVELNRATGQGTGRNVVMKLANVPVFYTPWFRFPIDDRRKSGFLTPTWGTSSNSGLTIEIPYYWNIAPHYDNTFAPRYLDNRGLQLRTEFRYLLPTGPDVGSLQQSGLGDVGLEYLSDSKANKNRYQVAFKDRRRLTARWHTDVQVTAVSDDEYFEDLGNTLSQTSVQFLQRRMDVRYFGNYWNLLTRVQDYQTVDNTISKGDRPYQRLPQFLYNLNLPEQKLGLDYKLLGEWVNFNRDVGVKGNRLDSYLELKRPLVGAGYFAIPAGKIRYTHYNLNNTGAEFNAAQSRTVPTLSFDAGLIFDRMLWNDNNILTLEPRLYYLLTPFENQDDIPIFDTTKPEFTFSELFRDNRFIGTDRIGDANQLTTALTSRLLDSQNGREKVSASVGHILYFRSRKVNLPGETTQSTANSDIVGELSMRIRKKWNGRTTARWNPQGNQFQRASVRLRYQHDFNKVVNVGYSFDEGQSLNQTDFSLAWPIPFTKQWLFVGRWNYDVEEQINLETIGGLEYDSCCWKIRGIWRRFVNKTDGTDVDTFGVQFVFKGLMKLGSKVDSILERKISGLDVDD